MHCHPTYNWLTVTPCCNWRTWCQLAPPLSLASDASAATCFQNRPFTASSCASLATMQSLGEVGSDWLGLSHMSRLTARDTGKVSGLFSLPPATFSASYHDSSSVAESSNTGGCSDSRQSKKNSQCPPGSPFPLPCWGPEKQPASSGVFYLILWDIIRSSIWEHLINDIDSIRGHLPLILQ